jgi:hypothetical protein
MAFDYDINHYTYDDLRKMFNVKEGENISEDEIDIRIANIKFTAGLNTKDQNELLNVNNFLQVSKMKFIMFQNTSVEYDNVYPMTERLEKTFIKNKFLDKNEHVVIEQTKNIKIPKEIKLFNIQTIDRDHVSWPYSSEFEIDLPESIKDVTNIGLHDYNLSFDVQNISEFYQNNKLTFRAGGATYTIIVPDGEYNLSTLSSTIASLMDEAVGNPNTFSAVPDGTTRKMKISSNIPFALFFDKPESYTMNKWQIRDIYNLRDYWGLGYFMGFDKTIYESSDNNIIAPNKMKVTLNYMIYLEIDGFNHALQTNGNTGKVNSYFARIPMMEGNMNDSGGLEYKEVSAERISKLKVKLRFHNGVLLDPSGQNYDFTLSFVCKK